MRVWPWLVHLTALLALAVVGNAQRRAPFTGIVRDAAGRPVADALVECVWQPDAFTGGVADRRSVTTDADGRFATDLWVGHAYGMWVVGPTREDGTHLACAPTFAAVGGKRVDLVLDRTMTRLRPLVAGVAPWIKAGPLAVRVFVAAGCPLEHDITIPGDGIVNLPPLPVDEPTLCLVDGEGEIIAAQIVTGGRVQLPEPTNLEFVVEDAAGKPLAGAEILDRVHVAHRIDRPFAQRSTCRLRAIATTDAAGKASGLVPGRDDNSSRILHARLRGHQAPPSGWYESDRIEQGRPVGPHDDDVPVRFVMTECEPPAVQVLGAAPGDRVHAVFVGDANFRTGNGGGFIDLTWPVTANGERLFAADSYGIFRAAWVTAWRDASVPTRLFGWSGRGAGAGAGAGELDLNGLRRVDLEVVDAEGDPAPFTLLAVTSSLSTWPARCYAAIVTDDAGRAVLHLPATSGVLLARRERSSGIHELRASDDDTHCRITLVEHVPISVTVVDPDGMPVPRARFRTTKTRYENHTFGTLAGRHVADTLVTARTEDTGTATLHVPPGFEAYHAAVHTRDGRALEFALPTAGRTVTVRVPN